jgi:hypothetical protein
MLVPGSMPAKSISGIPVETSLEKLTTTSFNSQNALYCTAKNNICLYGYVLLQWLPTFHDPRTCETAMGFLRTGSSSD